MRLGDRCKLKVRLQREDMLLSGPNAPEQAFPGLFSRLPRFGIFTTTAFFIFIFADHLHVLKLSRFLPAPLPYIFACWVGRPIPAIAVMNREYHHNTTLTVALP